VNRKVSVYFRILPDAADGSYVSSQNTWESSYLKGYNFEKLRSIFNSI